MLQKYIYGRGKEVKFLTLSLLLLALSPLLVHAQLRDNLYLENETSVGNVEIIEVGKKKVKLRNQQGKEFDYNAKELLLAFNGKGRFLIFPARPEQVEAFFLEEEEVAKNDVMVTLSRKVIPGTISKENSNEIAFQEATGGGIQNFPTSEIAAVIYKNGDHKLFASPSRASEILIHLKDQVVEARKASFGNSQGSETNVFSSTNTETKRDEASAKPVAESSGRVEKSSKQGMEIDAELYSRKALQKTTDLGTYLAIISDRNSGMSEANKAVELAVNLFINEDAQIEVSSKEGRDRYKVRAYLNRLKLLKYDRIEITWTDISYVSDLKKGMDGNYYGIITLQQRFQGFMDNQVVYSDLTEKNVEVMVMAYEKESDGRKQEKWDVFLSDIGVVVTKFDQ